MIRLLILALWLWPSQASPPTLIITQHGLERLTITWSGAPGGAQVVYGKAVVGAGTSGSIDIPPAQIYPGRAAVLFAAALAAQTVAGLFPSDIQFFVFRRDEA